MSIISTPDSVVTVDRLYIDGRWQVPEGTDRITVTSPNTGETIAEVPDGASGDIDAAVSAARRAFDDPQGWSSLAPTDRADHLRRFADEIMANPHGT